MPQLSPKLLEKRLKLGIGVSEEVAIQACEEACRAVGLAVVARGDRSLVFLPRPSRSLLKCMIPGSGQDRSCGRGVTAEIVPSRSADGRLVIFIAADRKGKGKTFVLELRTRLRLCASWANRGKIPALHEVAASTTTSTGLTTEAQGDSSAYYEVSRLLLDHREGNAGAFAANFVTVFSETYPASQHGGARLTYDYEQQPPSETPMAQFKAAAQEVRNQAFGSVSGELRHRYQHAVERYLFARVGANLWNYYVGNHSESDAQYIGKRLAFSEVQDDILYRALQVNPLLRGEQTAHVSNGIAASVQQDIIDEEEEELEEEIPAIEDTHVGFIQCSYRRAVAALSRVEGALSGKLGGAPSDAVEALSLAQCEMRTCALEASGGRMDLNSLVDMLPLFVCILLRSSITRPSACAQLMSDALAEGSLENDDCKVVSLFDSAVRYVTCSLDISDV